MGAVLSAYDALIAAGELRPDPEQRAAAERLDALARELEHPRTTGFLRRRPVPARGLYLWGGVGRGKSMLMDLFFNHVAIAAKRRVHFGEFMLEVHARIAAERRKELGDPIPPVAAALAEDARLLAFDEMMVTNSPDAMILSRLFTAMIESGVTVVTTSNRPPRDLYKNGLNREHFLPFIALIEARMDVLALNGPVDYRRDRLGQQDTWLVPNGATATAQLSAAFFRLTDYPPEDSAHVPAEELTVQGRALHVPKALKGVAVFSFKRLCGEARGTADYLAIARNYHTIFVERVPVLREGRRNEAKRFINLIDTLYDNRNRIVVSAEAEPQELYQAKSGTEVFEFDRTISRLIEMRSEEWVANAAKPQ